MFFLFCTPTWRQCKPSIWMRMMYYSVSNKSILGKKKFRVLLLGVEPKTYGLDALLKLLISERKEINFRKAKIRSFTVVSLTDLLLVR